MKGRRITRDSVLFVMGASGFVYETIGPRPAQLGLLPFFAFMVGLPGFLRWDRRDNDNSSNKKRDDHEEPRRDSTDRQ
jgi:hypothetical protein